MKHLTEEDLSRLFDTPMFRAIGEVADQMGLYCYAVGGYVRDLFLERPSKDIDCVVVEPRCSILTESHLSTLNSQLSSFNEGPGIRVAKALGKKLGRGAHVSVFRNFGTAQVKWKDQEVEFVGARRESYSRDSRKPIVEDGTLEDDLDRRDFTINALAYCLTSEGLVDGKRLIDRFGFRKTVLPAMLLLALGFVLLWLVPSVIQAEGMAMKIPVFIGSFLMMSGYLSGMAVFGTQLRNYTPEHMAGRFQGLRILSQVLIPGIIGPQIGAWVLRNAPTISNSDGTTSFLPSADIFLTALIVLVILIAVLSAWLLHNKNDAENSASMETRGNR